MLLKPARDIANVRTAFDMIRTCDSATGHRSSGEGRGYVRSCRVLRDADSGKQALRMAWMKRLPDIVALSSVLVLNATASPERCNLPFALRDGYRGNDFLPDMEWVQIKLRPKSERSQFLLKIINAPMARHHFDDNAFEEVGQAQVDRAKAEFTKPSRKNRGKALKLKRMRADAKWVSLLNFIEAITGRAITDGGTAGLITYKGVAEYLEKFRPLAGVIPGRLGAVAGLNRWENVDVLIVAGWNRPSREALIDETEAIYALDPEGRRPDPDALIPKVTQGLRVAGAIDGVPCRAERPTCPLVNDVYVERVVGATVQAIGRARGVRRPEDRRTVVIDISDTAPDLTYDAVVDWNDIMGTTELAAVLHSKGLLPEKPADLKALAPQHFSGHSQVRQTAFDLLKRTKTAKRSLRPIEENGPITSMGVSSFCAVRSVDGAARTCGERFERKTAHPGNSRDRRVPDQRRTPKACLVDSARRAAGNASLRSTLNGAQLSDVPARAKRAAHRPRHETPSADALRMRQARRLQRKGRR